MTSEASVPDVSGEVSRVTTWLNHHSALEADWEAVAQADKVGVDGTFLQLMLSLQGSSITRSSADLNLPAILRECHRSGRTMAFVGGEAGTAVSAAQRFPGAVLAIDGFDGIADHTRLVQRLRASGATVIVLGMGSPLQDRIAIRLREDLVGVEIFTAGGWLDQLAHAENYFPPMVHILRLGWLWRLCHEPRRLARRYTVEPFVAAVRLRHVAARLEMSGLRVQDEKRFFVKRDQLAEPDVVQIVTQLERAGAQTLSWWIEHHVSGNAGLPSYFLYNKSGSDLFADSRCLADTRPATPRTLATMLGKLRDLMRGRDVVIAHTHYAIAAVVLMSMSLRRAHRPKVVAVHHWPIDRYPRLAAGMYSAGKRMSLIDEEVFVSPSVRPAAGKGVVIENPVPLAANIDDRPRREVDLLIVARHSAEKSICTAVDAMRFLPERTLTLVGEGPLMGVLKSQVGSAGLGDRVVFAGPIPNAEVRTMMTRASALILPSRWEAMPMVLLEGIASSVPLVVSRIPAHGFLVEPGAALAFEVGDARGLAESVLALDDVNTRSALDVAVQVVRERLSEPAVANRWLTLVDDVLAPA
ncbi:WecB/TagA/CpsF family glycosyltransferase [Gordonia sp. SL306]|uniref:WecB/TagA/CpsF family glycosyltransferase n=1 Tax=Gordonia sp. SL306 TaxID=2995145 RepID=UPI00226E5EE4|nr:WecB/TagA/CpsF family glycosyltransferase [Gordonia sp. SL306]WAC56756.1 WecB/TagA/CpsF family glycosyltransferase [Gordonia sp. SL306]